MSNNPHQRTLPRSAYRNWLDAKAAEGSGVRLVSDEEWARIGRRASGRETPPERPSGSAPQGAGAAQSSPERGAEAAGMAPGFGAGASSLADRMRAFHGGRAPGQAAGAAPQAPEQAQVEERRGADTARDLLGVAGSGLSLADRMRERHAQAGAGPAPQGAAPSLSDRMRERHGLSAEEARGADAAADLLKIAGR